MQSSSGIVADLNDTDTNKNKTFQENTSLTDYYHNLVQKNKTITYDRHQEAALKELDRLQIELINTSKNQSPSIGNDEENERTWTVMDKLKESWFGNLSATSSQWSSNILPAYGKDQGPKGVYIHGGVGCGKTFCMNLFYDSIDDEIISKQKVHFHKFMLNVHQHMHQVKKSSSSSGDPLPTVVKRILENGKLICFDEFQVTDVADALILRRLFTSLLEDGAVLVATSNRPPDNLYMNGLQRNLFLPFIDLLKEKLVVVSMVESDTDYRLIQALNKASSIFFIGESSIKDFNDAFDIVTKKSKISSTYLTTQGRNVHVPKASLEYGIAKFSFDELCNKALGAADYLAIGENFHTIFIHDIPRLTIENHNVLRRFIIFVDAMYECHVKLSLHMECDLEDILGGDDDSDEAFAFDRTASRLQEMSSEEYLKGKWLGLEERDVRDRVMEQFDENRIE